MNSAEDAAKLEEQRLLRAMNRKSTVGLPSSRPPQKTAQPTQPVEKKPEQKPVEQPKPVENGGQAQQPEQKAPAPQPAVNNVNNGNNTASPRDPSKRHSMYNMNNELSNLKSIKDLIRKEEDRLQKTIQRTSSSEKIKPVNPPAKQTPERSFTPAPTPVSVAPNNNTAPRQRPTSVILSGGVSNPAARKSTSISHFNAPVTVKKTEPASPSKPPQTSTPVTSPQPKPTPAPSPASAPAPAPAPAPSNPSPARRPSNATAEKAKELVDKFDEITKIAKQSSSEDLSQYAPPPKKENPPPQPTTNNSTSASAKEFDDILNIISGIQSSSSEPPKKPEPTSAPVKLADMKSDRSLGSKNPARLSTSDLSAIDSILNALTQPLPGSSNQPSSAPAPSSSYKNTSGPLTPIFEIRVEKPAQLPADPKAFISSVVAIGRKVINALKLGDLSAFNGQQICTYVGELVSMVSYGMEIVPAPESKRRSVVEEIQAFSMVAFNFVKDADNHIHSGVWVMKNYDDQAEKVLDSLQNSLQSLKNVTKDVISNTPSKSTRLASLNDLAIETSVQAGQILSLLKNINPNMERISEYLEELVKTVRAGIQVLGNPQEKQLVANHLKEVLQKGIQLTTSVGAADKERKELVAAIAELLRSLT